MGMVFDGNRPDMEKLERVKKDLTYMTNRQRFCMALALLEMSADDYKYDPATRACLFDMLNKGQICLSTITMYESTLQPSIKLL